MRYVFAHHYGSSRDGQRFGPWPAGTVVELDPEIAAWINRDSPGACAPEEPEAPPAPEPAPVAPAPAREAEDARAAVATRDRMHRGGPNRSVGGRT